MKNVKHNFDPRARYLFIANRILLYKLEWFDIKLISWYEKY